MTEFHPQVQPDINHPEFLGCTMLGPEGAGCAVAGCWAAQLKHELEHLEEGAAREDRIKKVIEQAKASGCKNTVITNILSQ